MFASAKDEVLSRTQGLEAELAEARAKIKQLESRIETDVLLDILNRRGFERELMRAVSQASRYQRSAAAVFIDLDNFKSINDRFGHLGGDATLKAVATAIIQTCRISDSVARFGGDEFAVLLWDLRECDARAKALILEQTIEAIKMRFASDVGSVGASAGVTMLRRFDSPSKVIARADKDMYVRKLEKKTEKQHQPAASVVDPQQVARLFQQFHSHPAQLAAAAR
ncbi:MAG TPA: GGDEF domain-containing protein [Xanthobacteraceae bacterium]|nr:GGDEF domain-containing protein [Xanthobacteraceae bacterium]